jgi:hypothetical protein
MNPTTLAAWWLGICAETTNPSVPPLSGLGQSLLCLPGSLLKSTPASKEKPRPTRTRSSVDCGGKTGERLFQGMASRVLDAPALKHVFVSYVHSGVPSIPPKQAKHEPQTPNPRPPSIGTFVPRTRKERPKQGKRGARQTPPLPPPLPQPTTHCPLPLPLPLSPQSIAFRPIPDGNCAGSPCVAAAAKPSAAAQQRSKPVLSHATQPGRQAGRRAARQAARCRSPPNPAGQSLRVPVAGDVDFRDECCRVVGDHFTWSDGRMGFD